MSREEAAHAQWEDPKRFDDSKLGVKGLLDSGITSIPSIFLHPTDTLPDVKLVTLPESGTIPIIDLSGVDSDRRPAIVEQLSRASRELGFFQIVNHGVSMEVMERTISGIKAFHEQPTEVKRQWYGRQAGTGVSFFSDIDLFLAKAASWRDTIEVMLSPKFPELGKIPEICRKEIVEWNKQATEVAEKLVELLYEGLGVNKEKSKAISCLEGWAMVGHYYPHCPQPHQTFGFTSHIDSGVLTVLLQDHIKGLQIKHQDRWLDVEPVPGALTINIGDIFQMISNDKYKSVEHRVLANPLQNPRVSVVTFFNPGKKDSLYGPIPEVISPENPALYRQFTLADYQKRWISKEVDGKTLLDYYKV